MHRYTQTLPKLITMEEWLSKAHPDAPALPWTSDDGREVCSFAIISPEPPDFMMAVLFDAHGREVVRTADREAINATCLALSPNLLELTFLPAAIRLKRPAAG